MVVNLDRLASRYGVLPSRVLAEGNTLDLYVLDVALRHERYQADVQAGARTPTQHTREELQAMISRVKGEPDGKRS